MTKPKTFEELAKEYLVRRFPVYASDDSVMHIDVEVFCAGVQAAIDALRHGNVYYYDKARLLHHTDYADYLESLMK